MIDDYKPLILKPFSLLTQQEREDESRLIKEHAEKEGRSVSEILRVAMVRMKFADMGKGEFFDEMLVKSRKNGEDYMDFLKRMNRTYRTH